jgi:hypothetical protein
MKSISAAAVSLLVVVSLQGTVSALDELHVRGASDSDRTLMGGGHRDLLWNNRNSVCPPDGFGALENFDVNSYVSARWYIQKQIPVSYQPLDEFYCVTADYSIDKRFCLFCNFGVVIAISNRARKNSVTGTPQGGPSRFFRGIVRRPNRKEAKVTVSAFGAQFLPRSNYWVVAAGTYQDVLQNITSTGTKYEWAIITGGSPTKEGAKGKCLPDPGFADFLGMWMFTRDAVPSAAVIAAIERYADSMGLDTTAWLPVKQEGCVYNY